MRFLKHTIIIILLISSLLLASVIIPFSHAEITLDGTLGPGGPLAGPDYVISDDAGSLHGSNLFHSFGEFSVLTGESATFTGPNSIENVIGRVTGGTSSFIDGLLRCTILDAHLFLFNPSGVMFGPNAALDINGSFHVSTADFIRLLDNGIFYADPAQNSVLTVAPPSSFGFLNNNPSGISIERSTLQVPEGETLSVIGGDIEIRGGNLRAGSGQITLASVASQGEVILNMSDRTADLNISTFERLGEIDIAQDGELTVSGATPGSIYIRGGNLVLDSSNIFSYGWSASGNIDIYLSEDFTLTNNSQIASDLYYGSGQAGDILLEVGSLKISDGSLITSHAGSDNIGQGGNITIRAAESVSISSGSNDNFVQSYISSSTFGNGDGGTISISTPTLIIEDNAGIFAVAYMGFDFFGNVVGGGRGGDIFLDVGSLIITNAGISSQTGAMTTGHAGNITITATDSVSLFDNSAIRTETWGSGNGGTISISTPELTMDRSGILAGVGWMYASGDAGDILLDVGRLTLTNVSQIRTSTKGDGQGGDVVVTATDSIFISGHIIEDNQMYISAIISNSFGSGKGGSISLSAPNLMIDNNGGVSAQSSLDGDSGDILVQAGSLTLTDGAQIDTSSFSSGQGGDVSVTANESISINGTTNDTFPTGFFSNGLGSGDAGTISVSTPTLLMDNGAIQAGTIGDGAGGGILVEAGTLTLTGGANINTTSWSTGQGGSVVVNATESVSISGTYSEGFYGAALSGIYSQARGSGNAGTIAISTPVLSITDSGAISGSTFGDGQGGSIMVTAPDLISISDENSGLYSNASGSGSGGDIEAQTRQLELTEGAFITARSTGNGNAGSITMNISDTFLSKNSFVTTEAENADGGNIYMNTRSMVYLLDSEITSSVGGGPETVGGNITIDPEYVILDKSSVIANAYEGKGGNIQISADTFLTDPDSVVSASSALGIHGTVDIRAPVINLSGILAPLPKGFLSAAELLLEPCEARLKGGKYSSFIVCGRDGLPIQPHGLLPSPLYLEGKWEEEN